MEENMALSEIKGSIFQFLSALFARHNVQAVLVGGYALIANKVQRMTFDIDFMVSASDCRKVEQELLLIGYTVCNRQEAFVQFRGGKQGLRDIDFLIGDRQTVETLIRMGKAVTIAGEEFIVPSPQHLIAMKLHSIAGNKMRELKDFPDVVQLISANRINPKDENIRSLFEKNALMELYQKIIE
jgi:D-arabinose 1-dehydrogenase-like Zn-dependent alcohol dehydrogenase